LYFCFLGLTGIVQMPAASGYGFGATVLGASVVFLLPGAMAGFITATASGRYIDRFGAMAGAATGVVGFAVLALAHSQTWQVIVGGILVNAYISLAYGALPALVIAEVDAGETGVATSVNAIARTVGASISAALVALLLSRHDSGMMFPPESSFTVIFVLGAVSALVATLFIAASRPRLRPIESVEELSVSRAMNHEWG
jgi:MFS family permease